MSERCISILSKIHDYEQEQEKLLNNLESFFGELPEDLLLKSYSFVEEMIRMVARDEGIPEEELLEEFFEK